MVSAALLRHAAFHPEQAAGRDRDGRRHRHPGVPALAGHQPGALLPLPPLMKQFFWAFAGGLRAAGLLRLAERGRGLRHRCGWRVSLDLLLRLLLADPADRRPDRDAQEASRTIAQSVLGGTAAADPSCPADEPNASEPHSSLGLACRPRFSAPLPFSRGQRAAADDPTPAAQGLELPGPFGTYDRGALQRGYQVYKEVCAACHRAPPGLPQSGRAGRPGISAAAGPGAGRRAKVPAEPNDKGEMTTAPGAGRPTTFPSPFPKRMPPAPTIAARCRPICR